MLRLRKLTTSFSFRVVLVAFIGVGVLTGALASSGTSTTTFAYSSLPTLPLSCSVAGGLDSSFNGTGIVVTPIGNGSKANAMVIQSDGKIVAAGYSNNSGSSYDFSLARYNTDGSLDTSFNGTGKVITQIGISFDEAYAVAIQPDGKIVAAGRATFNNVDDFAVVRYNSDGSLDTSFNGTGKVTTSIGTGTDSARSVSIQSDGKIVVVGYTYGAFGGGGPTDIVLVRYNADGTLDTSFNGNGIVVTSISSEGVDAAMSVAIQPDGKIVTAGYSKIGIYQFALVRYNSNGTLDTSFNGTGIVGTAILGTDDGASSVTIQPDGKIVAAGRARNAFNYDVGVARYNTDGSLDTSFSGDGIVVTPIRIYNDFGSSVALQADGKIVVGGYVEPDGNNDFAVVRYVSDGSLDFSFNGTGKIVTSINSTSQDYGYAVAVQSDGNIVLAGQSNSLGRYDFTLVRYYGSTTCTTPTATPTTTPMVTPTSSPTATATAIACGTPGSLDTSFNGTGKVTTQVRSGVDRGYATVIQPDGKIIVAGDSFNGSDSDFAVLRYNTDGTLDTDFNGTGKVTTMVGNSDDYAGGIALQADGKIVVVGRGITDVSHLAVVRYNSDGSLDGSFNGSGKVITPIGLGDGAESVAIQSDGKIVVAGSLYNGLDNCVVVRYNTDGSLDTSFNGTGIVTAPEGLFYAVAIQSDGKIVAAGSTDVFGSNHLLVRYNPDGALDTSFNGTGKIIGSTLQAHSLVIQSDGRILIAGDSSFTLTRYNTNGTLDNSFNGTGTVTTTLGLGSSAQAVALQPDGRIVAAGYASVGPPVSNDVAVVRYYSNGSLDTSFNGTGKVTTPIGTGHDRAYSITSQSDGRIVAAGYSFNGSNNDFALVRYFGTQCEMGSPTPTNSPTSTNTATTTPTDTPTPAGTPSISGVITYGNAIGNPVPPRFVKNVSVGSTAGSPPVGPVITGLDGQYTLTGFGSGPYTIKPTKASGPNSAISSNDAARIAQGVTGAVPFVSQNQRFTADTSGNGSVSSNDAALVARFAAGLTGFGNTGQWRFFVTGAPSPLPTPPQTYNDSRTYDNIVAPGLTDQDYVGLLIGEASGNWNPATHPRPVGSRQLAVGSKQKAVSGGPERSIVVDLPQVAAVADKEIMIPVSVQGAADKGIISYEFDLRYDPTVIQPMENPVDVAGTVSRGLFVVANPHEPGLLRVVVYGPMPIDENGLLLNLRFTAVGKPSSVSPLSWERIMFNEGEFGTLVTDGKIELF